ncbi:MAG: Type 1 glutamine amidotransferase-like domain-containing protein [Candidatus Nomurabacteria bacterium]|nr:MAG: Type 1 glutamine amidotransferase-like domain-containing protein [Candidatus Nomurabacteria bacterium]
MTKYILHGGALKYDTVDNRAYVQEILKDVPSEPTVLFIPFARDKSLWKEFFDLTKERFSVVALEKSIHFVMASENTQTFIEQIKNADAIYTIGGETLVLLEHMRKVPMLVELWQGKTVAGSSAGAQMLSRYFYHVDSQKFHQGLGILNVKVFVHWSEDKQDKLEGLESFGEPCEILKIPEQKFLVINQ